MSALVSTSVIAEIDWDFEDANDKPNPDLAFCQQRASFEHREACEYILHIGDAAPSDVESFWSQLVAEMREAGCTEGFINAYVAAKDAGATRVVFYC